MNGADQSDCSSCTAVKRSVAFFGIFFQEANHTKLTTPTGKAESKPKKKPEFKLEGKHVGNRLIFHRKTARTHREKHVQVGSTSQSTTGQQQPEAFAHL